MKLELKHIAPYLPYGLKVLRPDKKTILEIKGVNGNLIIFERIGNLSQYGDLSNSKPILRPLSDLTKEIDVDGERFVPIEKIKHWSFEGYTKLIHGKIDNSITAFHWNKLCEWHFDVFGLVEKDLAININQK